MCELRVRGTTRIAPRRRAHCGPRSQPRFHRRIRRSSVKGLASTLATICRLAAPYFYAEDRRVGRILLAAVIAIELSLVGINVMLNAWNNRFYNALQERNWDAFVTELKFFCLL